MDLSALQIALVALTFFAAGTVKGVTGMGLPTVAMAVLGALLSPLAAAALLLVPSLVTNVWQLFAGPHFLALLGRLWPMLAAIFVTTIVGSALLARGDTEATAAVLGLVLILYSLYTLLARQLYVLPRLERWLTPLIGLVTGMVTGATGVLVIPAVPYLQALRLEKDELVQALGLSFTVSTLGLAAGLYAYQALPTQQLALSALSVPPALVGMAVGQAIRSKVSPAVFRKWFLGSLLLLGLEMAVRPLM